MMSSQDSLLVCSVDCRFPIYGFATQPLSYMQTHVKCMSLLSYPKLECVNKILIKLCSIKFHATLYSSSWALPCTQTVWGQYAHFWNFYLQRCLENTACLITNTSHIHYRTEVSGTSHTGHQCPLSQIKSPNMHAFRNIRIITIRL